MSRRSAARRSAARRPPPGPPATPEAARRRLAAAAAAVDLALRQLGNDDHAWHVDEMMGLGDGRRRRDAAAHTTAAAAVAAAVARLIAAAESHSREIVAAAKSLRKLTGKKFVEAGDEVPRVKIDCDCEEVKLGVILMAGIGGEVVPPIPSDTLWVPVGDPLPVGMTTAVWNVAANGVELHHGMNAKCGPSIGQRSPAGSHEISVGLQVELRDSEGVFGYAVVQLPLRLLSDEDRKRVLDYGVAWHKSNPAPARSFDPLKMDVFQRHIQAQRVTEAERELGANAPETPEVDETWVGAVTGAHHRAPANSPSGLKADNGRGAANPRV